MQFSMKCDTFVRLNNVFRNFSENETREWLKAIYIERRAGKLIAIATNARVLAAELIGEDSGPDTIFGMTIDPALIEQCEKEVPFGGTLSIIYIDMLKTVTIKSSFGYQYPGNGYVEHDDCKIHTWRSIPDRKSEEKAPMVLRAEDISNMGRASPSGIIVFPNKIDGSKPVAVLDMIDPNWMGYFMPYVKNDDDVRQFPENKELPGWAK
jgi:hypothetical protein